MRVKREKKRHTNLSKTIMNFLNKNVQVNKDDEYDDNVYLDITSDHAVVKLSRPWGSYEAELYIGYRGKHQYEDFRIIVHMTFLKAVNEEDNEKHIFSIFKKYSIETVEHVDGEDGIKKMGLLGLIDICEKNHLMQTKQVITELILEPQRMLCHGYIRQTVFSNSNTIIPKCIDDIVISFYAETDRMCTP